MGRWKRRRLVVLPVLILIAAGLVWRFGGDHTASGGDAGPRRTAELRKSMLRLCPGSTLLQTAARGMPAADIHWRLPLLREMFESRIAAWCAESGGRLDCAVSTDDGQVVLISPPDGEPMEVVFGEDAGTNEVISIRMRDAR